MSTEIRCTIVTDHESLVEMNRMEFSCTRHTMVSASHRDCKSYATSMSIMESRIKHQASSIMTNAGVKLCLLLQACIILQDLPRLLTLYPPQSRNSALCRLCYVAANEAARLTVCRSSFLTRKGRYRSANESWYSTLNIQAC